MDKTPGFKLQYKAFENVANFVHSVQKVYSCTAYPDFKTAHRIKRLGDAIQQELRNFMDLRKQVASGDDESHQKSLQDLYKVEAFIPWGPLSKEEMDCIKGLSPADITSLSWIADPGIFQ